MNRKELRTLSDSRLDEVLQIAGTNYDRRRKVTNDTKRKMAQMVEAGKSYTSIANHFNVTPYTVKLNTNEDFRKSEYTRRNQYPSYTEYTTADVAERIAYKKSLLDSNKKLVTRA